MDDTRMRCEPLDVEGSFNVRDLGGYKTAGGRITKPRRFLRAGSLYGLTPQGRKTLLDAGVRCVLDLRSFQELKSHPSAVQNDDGFDWYHIPMLDYVQSAINGSAFSNFPASMEEMYTGLLEEGAPEFRRVFELFADPRYPGALFHCTAGKDRTGVTAMLLLALAGVDAETIVEDYSHSERLLAHLHADLPKGFPAYVLWSKAETMRTVLAHLESRYGGGEAYLAGIGVTPAQRAGILEKFLG